MSGSNSPTRASLKTGLRLDKIFNTILEKSSLATQAKLVSLKRKLAMWALCMVMAAPRSHFAGLPTSLVTDLTFFKEEIENLNPCGGKV